MDIKLIKVNEDIHESKRVNVMLNILHVFCNGLSTLLRTNKILAMDHDPSMGTRGIFLLKGGPRNPRYGGGGEELHVRGR